MDVLCLIIGNGKTIGKASLYMAMIMEMLWNGYMEMLLQFHMVSVVVVEQVYLFACYAQLLSYHIYIKNKNITGNGTRETYGAATYRKEQQDKAQVGQRQKDIRQVGEGKRGTYSKGNLCEKKVGKGTYEKTKEQTKSEGNITNEKLKRYKLKAQLKGHILCMGKDEGRYGKVIETYGKSAHKMLFARARALFILHR